MIRQRCTGLIRIACRLYPRAFRRDFADDLVAVFDREIAAALDEGSTGAAIRLCSRTLVGIVREAARERAAGRFGLRARRPPPVRGARVHGRSTIPNNHHEAEIMGAILKDIQLAFRTLRTQPAFSLVLVLMLALGIGATTGLYSVFRAVFLEPIPLPESDRLVVVMETAGAGCCGPASGPDYTDWVERNRGFAGMAALNIRTLTLAGRSGPGEIGEARRVRGARVTASAFDLLGVSPLLGRPLLPEDEKDARVVVLGHALWVSELQADEEVLGTDLVVDGIEHTIVGVMPEGFDVPSPWSQMGDLQLYLPFYDELLAGDRGSHGFPVIARLAPGETKATAQADMDRVMRELAVEYPDTNGDRSVEVFTVHEYLFGDVGTTLGTILAAAATVLLIACGNMAAMLLTRAADRESEFAVRTALGASRLALARLLFAEAAVLALVGGALGVVVAQVTVEGLRIMLPPTIPRVDAIAVDGSALGFAAAVAALTALAFGAVPALWAARTRLAGSARESGYASVAPASDRLRNAFIIGQIALGLVLVNGATLLVRSYQAVQGQELGFEHEGVLTIPLNPTGPDYEEPEAIARHYRQVLERVEALPGVDRAGAISRLPLYGGSNGYVWVEGTPPRRNQGEGVLVEVTSVIGDYFETLGIPLLAGRLLRTDAPPTAPEVVINRRFAELAWPGQDPLGKRFSFTDDPPRWQTVVGVVGDVRQWGIESEPLAQMFATVEQGWTTSTYLTVRTAGDLADLGAQIRAAVAQVDPAQPVAEIRTLTDRVTRTLAQRRFYTTLIACFAGAGLLLAAVGVYGTVSYFVARRVRELAVRVALGAESGRIRGLVLSRGIRLAGWGVAIGLVGAWLSTRLLEGLLYRVSAFDTASLLGGCAMLALVAVAASAIPAERALRVAPATVLRGE